MAGFVMEANASGVVVGKQSPAACGTIGVVVIVAPASGEAAGLVLLASAGGVVVGLVVVIVAPTSGEVAGLV